MKRLRVDVVRLGHGAANMLPASLTEGDVSKLLLDAPN